MKVVILAGGLGTRLSEETELRPKPLVEIGGLPIIWHIMKIYERAGLQDFVICCGYKGAMIKQFFSEYFIKTSDITVDLGRQAIEYHRRSEEKWRVTLVDTGIDTMTGGRVKRVAPHLGRESFCLTYGDGVADVDVAKLIAFHKTHGRKATVTAVPSPGRFGILDIEAEGRVSRFHEKPDNEMGFINGGFFVLEPSVLDYVENDQTIFERKPLERLAADNQLVAFRHEGFWKPMDTLRDKRELEDLWASGKAPWKVW
jgi:glucose-1-phosphate cytidylyltransferase